MRFLHWFCAAVALLAPAFVHAAQRKPNVIYIMADDLGYGDLGCYGQKRIRTPNIDRMAAEGMRFTQAYAGSTVCAPSRCALMTGLHTGHCYIRGNKEIKPEGQEPMPAGTFTVGDLMRQAGYETACVGKWGLGGPGSEGVPNKMGFNYYFGYLCQRQAHNYYPDHLWRNEQRVNLDGKTWSHALLTDEALNFVKENKDRPFFLYLAYTIPHAELQIPSDEPYGSEPWPPGERRFAAMITRMDSDVGRLLQLLKQEGIDDQTLVFFTSDNGAQQEGKDHHKAAFFDSSGPLRGIKRDLYEGGIRIPMIARWPGHVPAGAVSDQVWAFWDFLPTMAQLAGEPSPKGIDGISMLPALLGRPQQNHKYLYWEFHEGGFDQAIRMGDWKAVRHGLHAPIELYDLKTDLSEKHDVAAEHPDIVKRMNETFAAARTDSKLFPIRERRKKPAAR